MSTRCVCVPLAGWNLLPLPLFRIGQGASIHISFPFATYTYIHTTCRILFWSWSTIWKSIEEEEKGWIGVSQIWFQRIFSLTHLPKGWSIGGVTYLLDRISYHLQDNARIPPLDINPHLKGKGGHKVKIRAILPLSHISCLICFYKTRVHKWLLTIGCLFKILIFNLLQCSSLTHDYIDFFRQTDQTFSHSFPSYYIYLLPTFSILILGWLICSCLISMPIWAWCQG